VSKVPKTGYTQAKGERGHGIHTRESREQIIMLPDCIDDYITDNNSARVIETYFNSLDLTALNCSRVAPQTTGRPMYDPKDLLELYLYGYMNRIRSLRRLETESGRNLEVLWLPGKLTPDHKTIFSPNADCQFSGTVTEPNPFTKRVMRSGIPLPML
jgi:hypothetical protein